MENIQVTAFSTAANYINGLKLPNERDDVRIYCSDVVRWHRAKQGLSVHALAEKAGVSRMFIIRAEKYQWQSLRKMFKVFRALGLDFKLDFAPKKPQ